MESVRDGRIRRWASRPAAGAEYKVGDPAPPPNHGDTGSIYHWARIARIRDLLRARGWTDIRVDQPQVADGVVVGQNRPDIQAVSPGRQRVNVEVDTDPRESDQHQRVIVRNDPLARGIFIVINPRTGSIEEVRRYDPRTQRTISLRTHDSAARRRQSPGFAMPPRLQRRREVRRVL